MVAVMMLKDTPEFGNGNAVIYHNLTPAPSIFVRYFARVMDFQ